MKNNFNIFKFIYYNDNGNYLNSTSIFWVDKNPTTIIDKTFN